MFVEDVAPAVAPAFALAVALALITTVATFQEIGVDVAVVSISAFIGRETASASVPLEDVDNVEFIDA